MGLDLDDLEQRYLDLSRECHPDHHATATPEQQISMLERSARINDAYRDLRDPWLRAARILELRSPGVLDRNKQLCPVFLAEAMELSEEVADVTDASRDALRGRIDTEVNQDLDRISALISEEEWDEAATALHQSRYHRKAMSDLGSDR